MMKIFESVGVLFVIILGLESLWAVPPIKLSPPWITVVRYVNENYSVKCESEGQKIIWKYQNDQVTNNRSIYTVQKSSENALYLKFNKIEKYFRGFYYCWTKIKGKEYTKGFELSVIQPVTILSNTTTKVSVLNEGEDIEVECETEGEPPPIINWFFRNKLVSDNQTLLHTNSLRINNISWFEAGTYTCRAFQKILQTKDVEITYEINVRHKPSYISTHREIYGFPYERKNLTCIVSAYPMAYFLWYRNEYVLDGTKNGIKIYNDENMSILEVYLYDSNYGLYYCEAANALGYLIQTIELKKIAKPETPKLLVYDKYQTSAIISIFIEPYPEYNFTCKMEYTEHTYCNYEEMWRRGITMKCLNKRIENTNKTHCKISNLKPWTKYAARASLLNYGGYGNFSQVLLFRTRQESSNSVSKLTTTNFSLCIFYIIALFLN